MKKIFMFLFCTTVITSVFAQTGHRDYDDRNANNNQTVFQKGHDRVERIDNNKSFIYQRNMQIQRVTSEYDYRIQQVSYNRSLSRRERRFAVENLQSRKAQEISRIMAEYNSKVFNDDHNTRYDHDNGHGQYNR